MTAAGDLRAALGPLGVWASFDPLPIDEVLRFAATIEDLGYGALWVNESTGGREPFAVLGALARSTSRLMLGLGVGSVYARDAVAARAGARTLAEASGGRFVMGLGVSHRSSVTRRGHEYGPPLRTMTAYLDAYDAAPWTPASTAEPPLVLAALGDSMMRLAARRAAGAFPFLVPESAVRRARAVLDDAADRAPEDRPVLVVSQPAVLGTGPAAREAARASISRYLAQPNYRANLARAGFGEAAMDAVDGSLVDALVATGDASALRARVAAMHEAGADHVVVVPIAADGRPGDLATARAIGP